MFYADGNVAAMDRYLNAQAEMERESEAAYDRAVRRWTRADVLAWVLLYEAADDPDAVHDDIAAEGGSLLWSLVSQQLWARSEKRDRSWMKG